MTIVVTAATGQLGRLALEALLRKGVPAGEIVAGGRDLSKLADLADTGIQLKVIDYDRPDTLAEAFRGADKVLFISASEPGRRIPQHKNVIDAAKAANVGLIAYTSIANAGTTTMKLASDHLATEAALMASGLPVVLLRHGWYLEVYTAQIPGYLERGSIAGAAGGGRVSGASRADLAEADVEALLNAEGGEVYEMGGDESFTLSELAAEISRQSGREVAYNDLPTDEFRQVLSSIGLPAPLDEILADCDRGIRDGELHVGTGNLSRLLGRPTRSLEEAVKAALA
ncbi:NAD(P)-dependent oxidoreductase [Kineosporia sp. NBRC 101677]|uniref:SDR family oxidoreductase n=1 Tax=Kineosporia sp. NBRC 101677 TaxID=3032197 RepID=UPI0024A56E0F|nr:SDR family oxidoreductase [Kineosporia sp. NBRC 101677]GLY18775.1 NAD(P)-dependent oxidoreductase [Kineosporia sp. NBRC 101677]